MIKLNHLYCYQQGHWLSTDKLAEGVSQLKIFGLEGFMFQQVKLLSLIDRCELDGAVYIEAKINSITGFYHWILRADYLVLKILQKELNNSNFDYLLWPEKNNNNPRLFLFDMDSTFIQIEVIDELAKYHHIEDKVAAITESAMRGELDFSQSLITRVTYLKGLSELAISQIASKLPLSKGVVDLVRVAKLNACESAIVSGGFTPFVEKIKSDLSLYAVKANQLEVVDGQLTGKVLGQIVDAQAKADFLNDLCVKLNISAKDVMAVGDGANDLLMMQTAGFNLAYYAKPTVTKQANGRLNHLTFEHLIDLFDW